jgi:hypothetical protein
MMARVRGPIAASMASGRGVVGRQFGIDEDRRQAVLQDRVDGGGEARRRGNDLVPGFRARSPSMGEVRAESASRLAEEPELVVSALLQRRCVRDQALEFLVEAAGGQPAVERGIDQRDVGLGIEHAAGRRHRRLSGQGRDAAAS